MGHSVSSSPPPALTVFLRPFTLADAPLLHRWKNDDALNAFTTADSAARVPASLAQVEAWVEEKIRDTATQRYWAICRADSAAMIGYLSLNQIDPVRRHAAWGGILLADPAQRDLNHTLDAVYAMLHCAFAELQLATVTGEWLETHQASLLLANLIGFRDDATPPRQIRKNGVSLKVVAKTLDRAGYQRFVRDQYGMDAAE